MARAGQVVGLLGGSFDPAHEGHVRVTREALKRMGLDQVWWLVSPGNPLKARAPAPMADRLARARAVMQHPAVRITDLEARLGTVRTADTIARLRALYPGVRFVWLMGSDNLAEFHKWGGGGRSWRWRRWACWRGRDRPAGAAVGGGADLPRQPGGPGREPGASPPAGLGLRQHADDRCLVDRDPGARRLEGLAAGRAQARRFAQGEGPSDMRPSFMSSASDRTAGSGLSAAMARRPLAMVGASSGFTAPAATRRRAGGPSSSGPAGCGRRRSPGHRPQACRRRAGPARPSRNRPR